MKTKAIVSIVVSLILLLGLLNIHYQNRPSHDDPPGISQDDSQAKSGARLIPKQEKTFTGYGDYVSVTESNRVYWASGVLLPHQGSITAWIKLLPVPETRRDHVIIHSDDSRIIFYLDTSHRPEYQRDIFKIKIRAVGNRKAYVDPRRSLGFPSSEIVVDNNNELPGYCDMGYWCSRAPFPEGEWHFVAATWNGYPNGETRIYLDGELMGTTFYSQEHNDNQPLFKTFAVGFHPSNWTGEIIPLPDGGTTELVPRTSMSLSDAGVEIMDLRIYNRTLPHPEIVNLFYSQRAQS